MVTRKPPVVNCPRCGKQSVFAPTNPSRPFCSPQCKTIDLGAWASGEYVVPGNPLESVLEDDSDPKLS